MQYAPIFILVVWVVVMTGLMFQGRIMRYFHLTDARQYVSGQENYHKLNALMSAGDVSLYSHEFEGDYSATLSISYSVSKTESASNRFSTKNLDEAVEQAYAWSVERGFIKE